ncbi:LysR family transcriptional regulator [Staphylococcus pseudintermedius]|uniref:glutamate biosynthesis transcriptional regulator GltC n=1 Tax=Staphylococcus pseudintermedius TaxID=283734 RepID=UPI001441FCFB|nr:LysR family transcriptional regulator [Staphylococcus pseudintermedius]EGQ1753685.1 LysR family transcriptional regulator [Staphylococcus pseudintermedius]EGQ2712655.1 LysR family transcriptional regulator [Staphylococcus pseudintermedius]EGQ2962543.1 LysR family transcriptional regulator [Staphylococcus pseudintermedius]EGQ3119570.1 LysR family transcriptional regulator [Staphylococcus pseudintermedius]EGQ3218757.1 LysR family transcriptional regulator [Staphylococcus pseudintermedius]
MELKQLKYFVEVAKREHISEAALELNVAQSAISRHIHNLENELETSLFYRRGRNVSLTAEGKQLLEYAQQILEQVDLTLSQFQTQVQQQQSVFTIGYVDGSIGQILPQVLQTIENELSLSLIPTLLDEQETLQALRAQEIDFALTTVTTTDPTFEIVPLVEETYVLYGDLHAPMMNVPNPPLSHILKQPLYLLEPIPTDFKTYLITHADKPVRVLNQEQFARFILRNQKGFVLAPTYVNLYSQNQQWKKISLSHTDFKKTLRLIYRRDLQKPLRDEVIQIIMTHIQQRSVYH